MMGGSGTTWLLLLIPNVLDIAPVPVCLLFLRAITYNIAIKNIWGLKSTGKSQRPLDGVTWRVSGS